MRCHWSVPLTLRNCDALLDTYESLTFPLWHFGLRIRIVCGHAGAITLVIHVLYVYSGILETEEAASCRILNSDTREIHHSDNVNSLLR